MQLTIKLNPKTDRRTDRHFSDHGRVGLSLKSCSVGIGQAETRVDYSVSRLELQLYPDPTRPADITGLNTQRKTKIKIKLQTRELNSPRFIAHVAILCSPIFKWHTSQIWSLGRLTAVVKTSSLAITS